MNLRAMSLWWVAAATTCLLSAVAGVILWHRPFLSVSVTRQTAPQLPRIPPAGADSTLRFRDLGREAGVEIIYYGNPSAEHYMTEQNGGGVAMLDLDGDDKVDLFFSNGSHFERPADREQASQCLYWSVSAWKYHDVTSASGVEDSGFGMGCAAGDYDNDGFVDLFVAGYGKNRLWHNNGDGTFMDATGEAGVDDTYWSTSAAFADLDRDGLLDLYIVNYVDYSATDAPCFRRLSKAIVRIACDPFSRNAQPDRLYRNLRNGRFEEISGATGIAAVPGGKGLDVCMADFDDDGWLDVYVANDTTYNHFFHNLGGMRFEEVGMLKGVAAGADGRAQASMGIGCADYNGDGTFDLFVANFEQEVNDLYENHGATGFQAVNSRLRLDPLTRPLLGFGVVFADFDLDQWPDLFVANGHVWDLTPAGEYQYEMRPLLVRNDRARRFVPSQAGDYFGGRWLGRAAAHGDLDNDGDTDIVVTHLKRPPALLRNDSQRAGGSMRLRLVGTRSARQPLGARIEMVLAGRRYAYHVPSGGGFQASSDPRVILATGAASKIDELRVRWSNGDLEAWRDLPVQPALTLLEGTGERIEPSSTEPAAPTAPAAAGREPAGSS